MVDACKRVLVLSALPSDSTDTRFLFLRSRASSPPNSQITADRLSTAEAARLARSNSISPSGAVSGTYESSSKSKSKSQHADEAEEEERSGSDNEEAGNKGKSSATPSAAASAPSSSADLSSGARCEARWPTKVFAVKCLSRALVLIQACKLQASSAVAAQLDRFLRAQLADLLRICSLTSSASFDPLRIAGIKVLASEQCCELTATLP